MKYCRLMSRQRRSRLCSGMTTGRVRTLGLRPRLFGVDYPDRPSCLSVVSTEQSRVWVSCSICPSRAATFPSPWRWWTTGTSPSTPSNTSCCPVTCRSKPRPPSLTLPPVSPLCFWTLWDSNSHLYAVWALDILPCF